MNKPASSASVPARLGRIISSLVVVFLTGDGLVSLLMPELLSESSAAIGFSVGSTSLIGTLALTCAALYAIPRTAMLGAILITGFLGGAVAAQVRVSPGEFPAEVIPALTIGVLTWLGLWLRAPAVRAMLPVSA